MNHLPVDLSTSDYDPAAPRSVRSWGKRGDLSQLPAEQLAAVRLVSEKTEADLLDLSPVDAFEALLARGYKHMRAINCEGPFSDRLVAPPAPAQEPRKVTMPAGTYYLCDPCYALSDDNGDYDEFLQQGGFDTKYMVAKLSGRKVMALGTATGDGCYEGSDGNMYPVDAGIIGVIPVALADGEPFGSSRVRFDEDFECYYDKGDLHFGHITISTGPEWSDLLAVDEQEVLH